LATLPSAGCRLECKRLQMLETARRLATFQGCKVAKR
jgi:hypothetical protein